MREFRRAGIDNVSMLVSEINRKLSADKGAHDALRKAVEAASRGIAERTLDFGGMSQVVVSATEQHIRAARLRRRRMKASDARLARALSSYLDREARLLWETFGEEVPAKAGYDGTAFRDNLVFDLISGGILYEGIDENELPAYGWTERGRELIAFPAPIGPGDSRVMREDFRDLFASG